VGVHFLEIVLLKGKPAATPPVSTLAREEVLLPTLSGPGAVAPGRTFRRFFFSRRPETPAPADPRKAASRSDPPTLAYVRPTGSAVRNKVPPASKKTARITPPSPPAACNTLSRQHQRSPAPGWLAGLVPPLPSLHTPNAKGDRATSGHVSGSEPRGARAAPRPQRVGPRPPFEFFDAASPPSTLSLSTPEILTRSRPSAPSSVSRSGGPPPPPAHRGLRQR
jgi:hypothetical protein